MAQPRDTERTRANPTPSRRTMITAGAFAMAVAAGRIVPAATLPTHQLPDAELIAACREFLAADADMKAMSAADAEDEEVADAIHRRWYAALERLTAIPARTQAGRLAKAEAAWLALASTGPDGLHREEAAALAALADLIGRTVA